MGSNLAVPRDLRVPWIGRHGARTEGAEFRRFQKYKVGVLQSAFSIGRLISNFDNFTSEALYALCYH